MAIFSAETTISPFGGDVLSTPIVLAYDGDKIVVNSLFPQTDPLKSYFFYDLGKNSKGKSLIGTAYVNASVADIVSVIGNEGLRIIYVDPTRGVNISYPGDDVSYFQLSNTDDGTKVWTVSVVDNPSGAGEISNKFDTDTDVYFHWDRGVFTASGTIHLNVNLAIGEEQADAPCSVVILPTITADPALPIVYPNIPINTISTWDLFSNLADADSSWSVTNINLNGATGTSVYIDNSDLLNPKLVVAAGSVTSAEVSFEVYVTSISNHICKSSFYGVVIITNN